jgi:hypothetical protein
MVYRRLLCRQRGRPLSSARLRLLAKQFSGFSNPQTESHRFGTKAAATAPHEVDISKYGL